VTYTLHGPAVPLTSNPSSLRITTQTLDPPPSAQSTKGGGEPGGVGNLAGIASKSFVSMDGSASWWSTKQLDAWLTKEENPVPAVRMSQWTESCS